MLAAGDVAAAGGGAAAAVVFRAGRLGERVPIALLTVPVHPLTKADRLTLERLARMETRRPEEVVAATFTDAADEDPLRGLP